MKGNRHQTALKFALQCGAESEYGVCATDGQRTVLCRCVYFPPAGQEKNHFETPVAEMPARVLTDISEIDEAVVADDIYYNPRGDSVTGVYPPPMVITEKTKNRKSFDCLRGK